jgi:hypothetical protein
MTLYGSPNKVLLLLLLLLSLLWVCGVLREWCR